jgi:hypothetical protein
VVSGAADRCGVEVARRCGWLSVCPGRDRLCDRTAAFTIGRTADCSSPILSVAFGRNQGLVFSHNRGHKSVPEIVTFAVSITVACRFASARCFSGSTRACPAATSKYMRCSGESLGLQLLWWKPHP